MFKGMPMPPKGGKAPQGAKPKGAKPKGKLNAAKRKALPKSDFGVPSKAPGPGSYPMPDRSHAADAKSRAAANAPPAQRAQIDAKANRILGK